jgi:hypothetical protein
MRFVHAMHQRRSNYRADPQHVCQDMAQPLLLLCFHSPILSGMPNMYNSCHSVPPSSSAKLATTPKGKQCCTGYTYSSKGSIVPQTLACTLHFKQVVATQCRGGVCQSGNVNALVHATRGTCRPSCIWAVSPLAQFWSYPTSIRSAGRVNQGCRSIRDCILNMPAATRCRAGVDKTGNGNALVSWTRGTCRTLLHWAVSPLTSAGLTL